MQQVAPVSSLAGAPPASRPPSSNHNASPTHPPVLFPRFVVAVAVGWARGPAGISSLCAACGARPPRKAGGRGECARGCGVQLLCALFSSDARSGEGFVLLFSVPASSLLRFSRWRQCLPHASEAVMTFRAWSRRTRPNCALLAPSAWTLSWCGRPERTSKEGSCTMRPFFLLFRLRGFFSSPSWPHRRVLFSHPSVLPPSLPLFLRSTGSAWFTS